MAPCGDLREGGHGEMATWEVPSQAQATASFLILCTAPPPLLLLFPFFLVRLRRSLAPASWRLFLCWRPWRPDPGARPWYAGVKQTSFVACFVCPLRQCIESGATQVHPTQAVPRRCAGCVESRRGVCRVRDGVRPPDGVVAGPGTALAPELDDCLSMDSFVRGGGQLAAIGCSLGGPGGGLRPVCVQSFWNRVVGRQFRRQWDNFG